MKKRKQEYRRNGGYLRRQSQKLFKRRVTLGGLSNSEIRKCSEKAVIVVKWTNKCFLGYIQTKELDLVEYYSENEC